MAQERADVSRLDLSRWLNQPTRPSNITGDVGFDLDLQLGQHFPGGTYRFVGPHAAYLGYEADQVNARGHITHDEAIIATATATAYGANVRVTSGSIGIDAPFVSLLPAGPMASICAASRQPFRCRMSRAR